MAVKQRIQEDHNHQEAMQFFPKENVQSVKISWMQHRMQVSLTIWFLLHMRSCLLNYIKKDLEQDQCQVKMELLFS